MQPTTQELIAKVHAARELLMEVCIALNAPTVVQRPKRTATPPMPKKPHCVGDSGKLRAALWECGWFAHAKDLVFSDTTKNWRRIKLWRASLLFQATQAEQHALSEELHKQFGDRIIKLGFIPHWRGTQSLCIWLRK